MHFGARDSSFFFFFFCKYGARLFFARPFFRHNFFLLVCFQVEVKQLSSWKFLIGIGFVIGLAMMFLD